MNPLNKIQNLGQSIWLDLLNREIMNSGQLKKLIDDDDLRGLTSNPSIFEKAISAGNDYQQDITELSQTKSDNSELFFGLAIKDIQQAADIFKPLFEKTNGKDGFVSLEVSPYLARDTSGTIAQAKDLWQRVDRPNVMIKIPGTQEGLAAIRECLREGININVTLLFGLPRYKEITEAFMSGLEDRLKDGNSIEDVSSVASFFLSRIDVMVDPLLKEKNAENLYGKIAIASAKEAYQIYLDMIHSARFKALAEKGAKPQRVLYASTSAKDPKFSDVIYVENLIGKDTINTLPLETIDAFRDHGHATETLTEGIDEARKNLRELAEKGINLDDITQKLEDEGIGKFNESFDKLLKSIDQQKNQNL